MGQTCPNHQRVRHRDGGSGKRKTFTGAIVLTQFNEEVCSRYGEECVLQDQPEGTYRDALNAVVNLETGTVNNEYGTESVGGANMVLGAIPIDRGRVVFLGLDNSELSTIAL